MAEQQDSAPSHADLEHGGAFAVDPKNLTTYGLEHAPARSGQLRVGRDVQHGLGEVSHPVWMPSERLAFIWSCIFGSSAVADMHPSLRILKLSGTGKNAVRRSLFWFLERRTHAGKAVVAGHTRHRHPGQGS